MSVVEQPPVSVPPPSVSAPPPTRVPTIPAKPVGGPKPSVRSARPTRISAAWLRSPTVLAAIAFVIVLVALELVAVELDYPLRVTSDTPTYLALLRQMALHPLAHQSVFLSVPGIATPDATPYTLALGELWHAVAAPGQFSNPVAEGRFLGLIGIPVSLATLAMIAWYAVVVAGRRQGLLAVAVLMVLFGPAHVIWANDLTFNGLMYGGFFPQNVAIALALGTLLALRGRGRPTLLLCCALAGATFVVHPLTGTIMAGLASLDACIRAVRREGGAFRAPVALTVGFLAGTAWPAYKLNLALALTPRVPGSVVIAGCAVAPVFVTLAARLIGQAHVGPALEGRLEAHRERTLSLARRAASPPGWLAIAGAAIVTALAIWEIVAILTPPSDPLLHSSRLSIYWGEQRWRWFLMLAGGAVGLSGLVRLALRRQPLPLLWFTGCVGIALLGAIGVPVPVWWRFLLYGQIPLAIGAAVVLVEDRPGLVRRVTGGTLGFLLAFKLATLLLLPSTVTYLGSPLQEAYTIGRHLPAGPAGLVASDPFTSYYIPAATGRKVLTVTKGHVTTQSELNASTHGYALLHDFYTGGPTGWWRYGVEMWNTGVRFVLVEKSTSLRPSNLVTFSTGPTPLVRTPADRRMLGRYFWRLGRIGKLLYTDQEYALYELEPARLFPSGARG